MDRTPPRALRSLIAILVIAVIVLPLRVVMISLGTGYVPSWAFGILIAILIVLMIVRIIAMVGFGCPPYDFSRLYVQKQRMERREKVKGSL
jgi:membrane protein YdbS with pleckstrin-like domain